MKILKTGIRDITTGENVTVVEPCNLYECTLGDDVFVGPFTEIQRGVLIGSRTRIQSHSFICEGVTIGEDCFIAHSVCFINDRFKEGRPSFNPADWKCTLVEDKVTLGSGAVILPVHIASNIVVGAGAVVTKDLSVPGIYAGNPARLIRQFAHD